MTKKEIFIEEIETIISQGNYLLSVEALDYFKSLKEKKEKTGLTDNGKKIIEYLQTLPVGAPQTAKEIGEALFLSGRSVSGAMRKIVADGYVDKEGKDPVKYALNQTGKELNVD
jgi:DNA-binding MarR family transcriptional regulator